MVLDKILVIPFTPADRSEGGLILPDVAKEAPTGGRVVAVGPGPRTVSGARSPMGISVGDVVLYDMYAGKDLAIAGRVFRVLVEADVLTHLPATPKSGKK
jgi:chaperonin GroES